MVLFGVQKSQYLRVASRASRFLQHKIPSRRDWHKFREWGSRPRSVEPTRDQTAAPAGLWARQVALHPPQTSKPPNNRAPLRQSTSHGSVLPKRRKPGYALGYLHSSFPHCSHGAGVKSGGSPSVPALLYDTNPRSGPCLPNKQCGPVDAVCTVALGCGTPYPMFSGIRCVPPRLSQCRADYHAAATSIKRKTWASPYLSTPMYATVTRNRHQGIIGGPLT